MKQRGVPEMRLLLEPLDVLMFRSSRPFFRGEQTIAEAGSISPTTFAGAIKTKLLLDYNSHPPPEWWKKSEFKKIVELIGSPEDESKISLRYITFANLKTSEEYFPLPKDVVFSEDSAMLLKPLEGTPLALDNGLCPLMSDSFYVDYRSAAYLSREGLINYLQGEVPLEKEHILGSSKLYQHERRTGITLNKDKKTTDEGMLYSADFLRLRPEVGFIVRLDGIDDFPEKCLLKIGGEGRACVCKKLDDWRPNLSKVIEEVNKSSRFKLYFATPTIFKANDNKTWWCPNLKMLEEKLNVELSLVAVSLGKPVVLGGWDAAKGRQKPIRKAVPEGTVYFFKLKERKKLSEDLEMPLQISDHDVKSGLGSTFIGVW
jgi:CRISPR-associated protein Cmr3